MRDRVFFARALAASLAALSSFAAACGTDIRLSDTSGTGGFTGTSSSGATGSGCALPPDQPGDCQRPVCIPDGTVAIVEDPGDVPPDDGLECTASACAGGAPVHSALPAHTPCAQGQKVCDGSGKCVGCLTDADCLEGQICKAKACFVPLGHQFVLCGCNDGWMMGACMDVDCASAEKDAFCAPFCAQGGGLKSAACLEDASPCAD